MNIRAALLLSLTTAASLSLAAALASCVSGPPAPKEVFDEQTAATLLVVAKPLVFARERSDVAAHARDYATLVAVEDDRSGEYTDYLLLYRWSTVDRRMSPPPAAEAGALRILADGRAIDLKPLDRLPVGLNKRRELHLPEHGDVTAHAYRVDVSLLHFLATSRELSLRMPQEPLDTPFGLWDDGRPALDQFLRRAGAS
jgi:hypothetical protein